MMSINVMDSKKKRLISKEWVAEEQILGFYVGYGTEGNFYYIINGNLMTT